MNISLSQLEIGRRIMELRKSKGLTQDELAHRVNLSRPSLTQLELGNRNLDVFELYRLAQELGFSLDEFMSSEFKTEEVIDEEAKQEDEQLDVRISVPELNVAKFKNVLLYILERCAGKPNIGETALNKLLYFCDFNYYEIYEEHLTGARYKKLPFGPVPHKLDSIINSMIQANQLKRIKTTYFDFPQTRYIPLEKAALSRLSAAEKTVIDQVINQMSDWSATKISEYSHKDMPWLATNEGEYISYNLAFYREMPYSVRQYEDEK